MFKKIKEHFTTETIKAEFSTRALKAGSYSLISALLIIAIAATAVGVTSTFPPSVTQIDLTENKLYALSEQSKNIVNGLTKEVEIFHLVQSGAEDSMISNMLHQYKSDKIKITAKDPVVYPGFAAQYTDEPIYNNSIIVSCEGKSKYISYDKLYNVEYMQDGSQSADFNGEALITGAISFVSSDDTPVIYSLTGHGSTSIGSDFTSAISNSNAELELLNLITEQEIPDNADVVLLFNPETDISDSELALLKDFMLNGGNLIVITGYTDLQLPNLNSLMNLYGATYENSLVMESSPNHCIRGYNHYLLPDIHEHTLTSPVINGGYSILLPQSHPIIISENLPDDISVTPLFSTTANGYVKQNAYQMTSPEKTDDDRAGSFTVGIAAQSSATNSKLVWISSALAFTDGANQTVSGTNCDFFLNAINWMCEREEGIAIHAKPLIQTPLTIPSGMSTLWSVILVFIIPIAILGTGIYVYIKRKKR